MLSEREYHDVYGLAVPVDTVPLPVVMVEPVPVEPVPASVPVLPVPVPVPLPVVLPVPLQGVVVVLIPPPAVLVVLVVVVVDADPPQMQKVTSIAPVVVFRLSRLQSAAHWVDPGFPCVWLCVARQTVEGHAHTVSQAQQRSHPNQQSSSLHH